MTLKEQAIQNLKDFKAVADKLKIPFVLMDGTLLGAIRDKDIIESDEDDIDVGILEDFRDKIPELVLRLVGEKNFINHKAFFLEDLWQGCGVKRGGNHVDILCIHTNKEKGIAYNLARNRNGKIGKKPYFAYVYPYECFNLIQNQIRIFNEVFYIPRYVEKFLLARYGESWKVKKLRKDGFQIYDIPSNPAITPDPDFI